MPHFKLSYAISKNVPGYAAYGKNARASTLRVVINAFAPLSGPSQEIFPEA